MKLLHTIGPIESYRTTGTHLIVSDGTSVKAYVEPDYSLCWIIPMKEDDFLEVKDDKVILSSEYRVSHYNISDGQLHCSIEMEKEVFAFMPDQIILEESIADEKVLLELIEIANGNTLWSIMMDDSYRGYLVHPKVLLVYDMQDVVAALELSTGKILWKQSIAALAVGETLSTLNPAILRGDYFYCFTNSAKMLRISVFTGMLDWSFYNEKVLSTVPAFFQEQLYFSSSEHLMVLNVNGSIIQEIKYDAYVKGASFYSRTRMAVDENYMVLGNTRTSEVLVFDRKSGLIKTTFFIAEGWSLSGNKFLSENEKLFAEIIGPGKDYETQLYIYSLKPDDVS